MTYNVELTAQPDKRGFHHVMIRLHEKGHKPARIQTEYEIEAKLLSKKPKWGKWVRPGYPHAEAENEKIIAIHKKVKDAIWTCNSIVEIFLGGHCSSEKIRFLLIRCPVIQYRMFPLAVVPTLDILKDR